MSTLLKLLKGFLSFLPEPCAQNIALPSECVEKIILNKNKREVIFLFFECGCSKGISTKRE
jgi:hypothetical protein